MVEHVEWFIVIPFPADKCVIIIDLDNVFLCEITVVCCKEEFDTSTTCVVVDTMWSVSN
ncbi:MAG: hypothetical protein R2883_00330 [Caldisericia bacterium]